MSAETAVLEALLRADDDEAAWSSFAELSAEQRAEVSRGLKARVDELVRSHPPESLPVAEALVRSARGLGELER